MLLLVAVCTNHPQGLLFNDITMVEYTVSVECGVLLKRYK